MYIGDLAKRTGLNVKTLRYYEDLGLLAGAERTDSGYRTYTPAHVEQLKFIQGAKALGLSLAEIKEIIDLWSGGTAPCEHVSHLLDHKLADLDRRILELVTFRDDLRAYKTRIDQAERPSDQPCKHIAGVEAGQWSLNHVSSSPFTKPDTHTPAP